jgi:DNA-binding CsgD family transcriptional regulator
LGAIHRRRQFTVAYIVLVVGIAGAAGIAALIGSLQVSLLADRAMLVFTVLSRLLALCISASLFFRYRNQRGRRARTALLYAGGFFILMDGSWLAMYALGMMGFLHARLYDGLHLTRLLLLAAIVVIYLGRFLDAFEGTQAAGSADEELDPRLVAKYGISGREQEIIRHLRLGRSNEEIAGKLFISSRTVKGHLYRIFQKTNVKNRVQLANLFADRGRAPGEESLNHHSATRR